MEKDIINYLTALLTPLIAIMALWIARQQWIVQRYKAKFDLFEHRMKIYEGIRNVLTLALINGSLSKIDHSEFNKHVRHSSFLFDKKINRYISEIEAHVREAQITEYRMDGPGSLPVGEERSQYVERNHMAIQYLSNQLDVIDRVFSEYMKINKI